MSSPTIGRPASANFFAQVGSEAIEDRQRVDEAAAGVDRGLRVVLVRILRADRQVGHDHVDARVAERLCDVDGSLVDSSTIRGSTGPCRRASGHA